MAVPVHFLAVIFTLIFSFSLVTQVYSLPLSFNLIIFFSFFYILFLHQSKPTTTSAGFKHYPLVGVLPSFLQNQHRFLDWSSDVLSTTASHTATFRLPGDIRGVITSNPAVVEYILKTNFANYPKGPRLISLLEDFLGKGIFNSDGDVWKLQRKTASFEFCKKSLRDFGSDCVRFEIRERLLPLLKDAVKNDRILDLQDVFERFAFDNICKLAFNVDPHCLSTTSSCLYQPEFMQAFDQATKICTDRCFSPVPLLWKIRKFFNIGSERKLRQSIHAVHGFADNIIKQKLEQKKCRTENRGDRIGNSYPHRDLLSRFIDSEEFNSPEMLRDIVISFILAGRDTTSSAVTWFFWLVSFKPEILLKIRSEIDSIRAGSELLSVGEEAVPLFSYEEINGMNYLHAAISESLRLYPPVPLDEKLCLNADVLPDGTRLKKGTVVTYHSYAMGRMEGIWGEDCREFRPERWLDDQSGAFKVESPFRYPVFHAGPRICLGKELAYIQMKSIVAAMVEKFDVEMMDEENKEYERAITLRMKGGLHVRMRKREI